MLLYISHIANHEKMPRRTKSDIEGQEICCQVNVWCRALHHRVEPPLGFFLTLRSPDKTQRAELLTPVESEQCVHYQIEFIACVHVLITC
jgi:hypothetical protein